MIQKEKQLLLVDLCARLPHHVIVSSMFEICATTRELSLATLIDFTCDDIDIKPYLRPMSSMTEEEEKEYINIDNRSYSCPMAYAHIPASDRIDWLNAHHFDYHGLIEKGLALEAPEGMYNFK